MATTTPLPTPPPTVHNKENTRPHTRVAWSSTNSYHTLSLSPPKPLQRTTTAPAILTKGILKQSASLLPFEAEPVREVTPEPSGPLDDVAYLARPVNAILGAHTSNSTPSTETLHALIEGYSILTARLRSTVAVNPDAATPSCALLSPLVQHRAAFVEALAVDLGRALVDPKPVCELPAKSALPSPKPSPKKEQNAKRDGMSAEEVKYARDLATTAHSVIKLLAVVFTLPAVYNIFQDSELSAVLTALLSIPLYMEPLPTPNARKTHALAIWLLQIQRLPPHILQGAADRIAYALRRGIEGELGREGKKGAAGDGLKAIHDLSIHAPSVFAPAFGRTLLPSVLDNLLAPTLVLRTQAAHALGGLAKAVAALPLTPEHTELRVSMAEDVADILFKTGPPSLSSSSPLKSGCGSPLKESQLLRTLRTTLQASAPNAPAQGPVWAMCVLAGLVVLVAPLIGEDTRVCRTVRALMNVGMRHTKSSVRALGCVVGRVLAWAYFAHASEDGAWWGMASGVVDMGAGAGLVCALMHAEDVERAFEVLGEMARKGGQTGESAIECVATMVRPASSGEWTHERLLAPGMFSASPGLLTAEWKTGLVAHVRAVLEECPGPEDVRGLSNREIGEEAVWRGIVDVIRTGLAGITLWGREEKLPGEALQAWDGMIRGFYALCAEAGDDHGIRFHADACTEIVIEVLEEQEFNTTRPARKSLLSDGSTELDLEEEVRMPTADELRISLAREMWAVLARATQDHPEALAGAADKLLAHLAKGSQGGEVDVEVERERGALFAEVVVRMGADVLVPFWTKMAPGEFGERMLNEVWRLFVERWMVEDGGERGWDECAVLLGVPFSSSQIWEMSSKDLDSWDVLLQYTIGKAASEAGVDTIGVLEHVARSLTATHIPTAVACVRIADLLLSQLNMEEARTVPHLLVEYVADTLGAAYPPEPRNVVVGLWLVRSVTRMVDRCPRELVADLLAGLEEGLGMWIRDEYEALAYGEYSFDIVPLYETICLTAQSLGPRTAQLEKLAELLEDGFRGREDKPEAIKETFEETWNQSWGLLEEPSEGWPKGIRACIAACGEPVEKEECTEPVAAPVPIQEDSHEPEVVERLLFPDSDDEEEEETPAPMEPRPCTPPPATPKLGSAAVLSTPVRPSKAASSPFAFHSPSSPSNSSPMSSPSRRRRVSGKENAGIESPSRALFAGPPTTPVLGKRREFAEAEKGSEEAKKARTTSYSASKALDDPFSVSDSESESDPFSVLEPSSKPDIFSISQRLSKPGRFRIPEPLSQSASSPSPTKKRKYIMYVELPAPRRRTTSMESRSSSARSSSPTVVGGSGSSVRRARSMLNLKMKTPEDVEQTPRKRRKMYSSSPASVAGTLFDSDDSIVQGPTAKLAAPASDDSVTAPFTPQHLVSPAIRTQKRHLDSDPPSDDSVMSTSSPLARMRRPSMKPLPLRLLG